MSGVVVLNFNFIFESILLLLTSVIVLRFAGKKSVAKMTALETVVILAIGTTMGHAVKENKLWQVILVLVVYGVFIIVVQKLELKLSILERYLIGDATLVINEGKLITDNLRKLRMTKKQLEMRLRQKGISYITDVKIGTIESDGEFGFELMPHAKPITQDELLKILNKQSSEGGSKGENIFDSVVKNNK
ncbi:DUF421 domain-containing protein [Neobacillus sp. PS3-12]|jgi:uncharacterized membrane protein YcaP (DUF421 family)|uniref:DUF421 domain-containing protein n=1 Tax=Neobacillus sp. PS3-12 TaxID=3070677 RepID=UPI0027DEC5DE|nr:YetF domain-containing protein [Neobacillus sp. PS3-12]WML53659.1 DUF421 domain-containing protein [Neobacillus sp. PS3-12]